MDVVLVRHGVQGRSGGRPLSPHGAHQVSSLAAALQRRKVRATHFLTSESPHAFHTAEVLRERLASASTPMVALAALTPKGGSESLDRLVAELDECALDLSAASVIVVVGHEGRLSNLATELTGSRIRPLAHGEALTVRADSFDELMKGRGEIHSRHPVLDHHEEVLREKVQSKMTVATFLAGFVFTALSAVLVTDTKAWPWHRVIATTALTGSLCLLVASVYVFDQLSTPVGFWTDAPRSRLWRWLNTRREHRRERRWERISRDESAAAADEDVAPLRLDGPVYRTMLNTSRWIYNPAVLLGMLGFVALLLGTANAWVQVLGCSVLAVALLYAGLRRPDLGAD
jgi:phosphohistidine phosphatase SixA